MNDMTMTVHAPDYSASFVRMKELIDRNTGPTFGGAVVIVPPPGGGDTIEFLMLDASGDVAQFWSTIKSRIDIVLDKLNEQQRVAQTYGRR